MTLMYQKEVSEKIYAPINKKNPMGSLMALSQNYFNIKLLCKVKPGCFAPPPKVDSAVLQFIRKVDPIIPISLFSPYESFLRTLFSNRRKQSFKVLKERYPLKTLEESFESLKIPLTQRAESFKLDIIQKLFIKLQ